MSPGDTDATPSVSGLNSTVIEQAAEANDVPADRLAGALDVLHAELIGRHSNLERTAEYVTVDGVRAYRVESSVWSDFFDEFDLDEATERAVVATHSEQARLLFAAAVGGDDSFADDEAGVVVGIDTAEQF